MPLVVYHKRTAFVLTGTLPFYARPGSASRAFHPPRRFQREQCPQPPQLRAPLYAATIVAFACMRGCISSCALPRQ
jgi:hypothetical protein